MQIDKPIPIIKNNSELEITNPAAINLIIISIVPNSDLSYLAKQLETKYKKRERRANNQIKDIK